jgi:hypothetical protein
MRLFLTRPTSFRGCIADCYEALRRRKLLQIIRCVDPDEELSLSHTKVFEHFVRRYPETRHSNIATANQEPWLS